MLRSSLTTCRFSPLPPPSLQQWIISPAEWEGGKRRAAGGSFRVHGFLALSPLWQFPPSTWPVSALQTKAILRVSRFACHLIAFECTDFFLALRTCSKSHVYILCLQTCCIRKLVCRCMVLCVLHAFFLKSCNLCRAFSTHNPDTILASQVVVLLGTTYKAFWCWTKSSFNSIIENVILSVVNTAFTWVVLKCILWDKQTFSRFRWANKSLYGLGNNRHICKRLHWRCFPADGTGNLMVFILGMCCTFARPSFLAVFQPLGQMTLVNVYSTASWSLIDCVPGQDEIWKAIQTSAYGTSMSESAVKGVGGGNV